MCSRRSALMAEAAGARTGEHGCDLRFSWAWGVSQSRCPIGLVRRATGAALVNTAADLVLFELDPDRGSSVLGRLKASVDRTGTRLVGLYRSGAMKCLGLISA